MLFWCPVVIQKFWLILVNLVDFSSSIVTVSRGKYGQKFMWMQAWPYPLSSWRFIGEYPYSNIEVESGHEQDGITDDYYKNLIFKEIKLGKLKDDIVYIRN